LANNSTNGQSFTSGEKIWNWLNVVQEKVRCWENFLNDLKNSNYTQINTSNEIAAGT